MPITTSAILGGIQSAAGLAQIIKGQRLAKQNKAPSYEIPKEIEDNLSQAQMMALEGLPPEQKKQYVDNIQRQQNFGLAALGDRKAGISGLATLTQQGQDAYSNLLSQDAAARQQNQSAVMDARTQLAGFKDKSFELNKLMPFQQKAEAAQGLTGAGMQNVFGGLSSIQGTMENKALAGESQDDLTSQYNVAKQTNPALTFAEFMKMNTKGGLGFANKIK